MLNVLPARTVFVPTEENGGSCPGVRLYATPATCRVARAFPLGVHLSVAPGLMNMSGMRLTDNTGFALSLDCPGWAFPTVHQ